MASLDGVGETLILRSAKSFIILSSTVSPTVLASDGAEVALDFAAGVAFSLSLSRSADQESRVRNRTAGGWLASM